MVRGLARSLAVLLVGACSVLCSGQCADGFNTTEIHCYGPDDCEDVVPINYPNESQDGVVVSTYAVECCGQLITSSFGSGNCEPLALRSPNVRRQLAELAQVAEVLVADCRGRYVLYSPTPGRTARRGLALVDDHILR